MYTTSNALLETLTEAGISYIFANFGSDHPGIVEALAEARRDGKPVPEVIICPNEMVGMSAAHGFWQASGVPQAVLVHVECGTQALAGAVHNAAKGRAPMLIIAGASPFTQEGELKGSRNEFIQWIQDVHDQRGIVRGYTKYDAELKTGANVKQMIHRALQFACSDPKGPAYLMAAREVLEEQTKPVAIDRDHWRPLAPAALPTEDVAEIGRALAGARRPLVVTSYLGRDRHAVEELVMLCDRLGVGVLESVPSWMNFPHSHPCYLGNQWNEPRQKAVLAEADVILVLDSDVPWIPSVSAPNPSARIFHVDVDPLKQQMPLWYIPATRAFAADAATALRQINAWVDANGCDEAAARERKVHYEALHSKRQESLADAATPAADGNITSEYFLSRLKERLDDRTLILNEGISNYQPIFDHLAPSRPGSMICSGGGSLGWHGGAAIGAKLAQPDATVITVSGDGCFMFSVPSSVHWMARRYQTPFLQIILNNGGWKSPKLSALAVHPSGTAATQNDFDVSFDPQPDYVRIAEAAGGAFGRRIEKVSEIDAALDEALHAVTKEKRAAVLDVVVRPL